MGHRREIDLDEFSFDRAFNLSTSIRLSVTSAPHRLAFSCLYAATSLFIAPTRLVVGWLLVVTFWEFILRPFLDVIVLRMSQRAGMRSYVVTNLVGASLFSLIGVYGLAEGSPVGVAIGATWLLGGALMCCVYFSSNRAMLLATLGPQVVAGAAAPFAHQASTLSALVVAGMVTAGVAACSRFSVDRRTLVDALAARKLAVNDLQAKLAMALEASGDGMFEIDLLTNETILSSTSLALLGYAPGDLRMPIRDWRTLVDSEDLAGISTAWSEHFRGSTTGIEFEHRVICKGGGRLWVLCRGRLVQRTADGRPWKLVGTHMDLAARKALELQLKTSRDLAESANRAKSVFLANMSHEIRTPLNGVIATAGALERTPLSSTQGEMVSLIVSSGHTLERLVSDVLDQAKIEAADVELRVAPFDLCREIETASELMRARADEKGLRFLVACSDAARGTFEGDAMRLRQIVGNLAANAIKFTEAGGVTLRVDCIDRRADAEFEDTLPSRVVIEVCDTGIGFDEDAATRLFARFAQADDSVSRRYGGSGLGLAICKGLVERMGGSINAASAPARGSTFTVELPLRRLARASTATPSAMIVAGAEPAAGVPSGLRILMAEDHPINRRVAELILQPVGVDLTIVDDGRSAVDAYLPGLFDLILMDMQMPVMDGLSAVREIRRMERERDWPPIPIAMLTANAMDEHRIASAQAGADHLIVKPITPETIVRGIGATLRVRDSVLEV